MTTPASGTLLFWTNYFTQWKVPHLHQHMHVRLIALH